MLVSWWFGAADKAVAWPEQALLWGLWGGWLCQAWWCLKAGDISRAEDIVGIGRGRSGWISMILLEFVEQEAAS